MVRANVICSRASCAGRTVTLLPLAGTDAFRPPVCAAPITVGVGSRIGELRYGRTSRVRDSSALMPDTTIGRTVAGGGWMTCTVSGCRWLDPDTPTVTVPVPGRAVPPAWSTRSGPRTDWVTPASGAAHWAVKRTSPTVIVAGT